MYCLPFSLHDCMWGHTGTPDFGFQRYRDIFSSCAEVKAELYLLMPAEDSAFLVSIRNDFKSHAATAAELDQKWSGIMLYCFFVLGCTRLGTAVSSKIKSHDSLPRAGFSEARGSQNRQNTLVERRKDKCEGPKGIKHEDFFFLWETFLLKRGHIITKISLLYQHVIYYAQVS